MGKGSDVCATHPGSLQRLKPTPAGLSTLPSLNGMSGREQIAKWVADYSCKFKRFISFDAWSSKHHSLQYPFARMTMQCQEVQTTVFCTSGLDVYFAFPSLLKNNQDIFADHY